MKYLLKTLVDLKEPAILIRLFIPFVIALIAVSLLGYGLFGYILTSDFITESAWVQQFSVWQDQAEQSIGAIPLVGGIMVWIIGVVATLVAGIIGIILGSYLVLLFAMIITGFMTDSLVKVVHDKHYPNIAYQGHGNVADMLWKLLKFSLLMLLLFILTLPLLFVPLINVVWFWLIGFVFFRYAIVLDVGQVILSKALFERVKSIMHWKSTSPLLIIYALSVFPIISFFAPVLAVIALAHYYFEILEKGEPAISEPNSPF